MYRPARLTHVAVSLAVVASACTSSTEQVAPPTTAQPTAASTTQSVTPTTADAPQISAPEPLLEFAELAPMLVEPGDKVQVSEGTDSVSLLGEGLNIDLTVEDRQVTLPEGVDGEVLLLERSGETMRTRPLFAASGDGIWLLASHENVTPGDVVAVWVLERGAADAQVLLMAGSLDEALPVGLSDDGILTPGLAEPTAVSGLVGRPLLASWGAIDEVAPSGNTDISAISDDQSVEVKSLKLGSCDSPATVEGSLGAPGQVRLASLAPSGRTGSVTTASGSFRFTTPPGAVLISALLEDGTMVSIPPLILGCGDTATVGSGVVGSPVELDLAQVTTGALGQLGPWRACRSAFISGESAAEAALALDGLAGLDILTEIDIEQAFAIVEQGDLSPHELLYGLAARSTSRRFDILARSEGWTAQPTYEGDLPISGISLEQAESRMRGAALCVTPQLSVAEPGQRAEMNVEVTGLDLEPHAATAQLIDPASSETISASETDGDGVANLVWTAPAEPGILPLEVVTIGAPGTGSSGARAVPVALGDSGGPRDRVAGSAVVGGVWVVQGSKWQEFSDEALFLEGSTFGGAVVACTAGPAINGPWHGAVWLSTGGLITLAAGFIELASALFGGLEGGVGGGRVVALAFAGALPVPEGLDAIARPPSSMFDALIRSQATVAPPRPVFPPDGTLLELFAIPFAGAMVDTSLESVGSGPLPLVSLETRPRVPIERIDGEIEFGPLLTSSPAATLRGPGGTITRARLFWRDACPLSASTVADAIDEFENLPDPFGP